MAQTHTQSRVAARPGQRRLRLVVGVGLLLAVLVGAGFLAFRAHYRLDLFDPYRAGYASVVPLPQGVSEQGGDIGGACRAALASAYPALDPDRWPDQAVAFWVGCNDRQAGSPEDPWVVHSSLGGDD